MRVERPWEAFQRDVEYEGALAVPGARWTSGPKTVFFDRETGDPREQVGVALEMPGLEDLEGYGSLRQGVVLSSATELGREVAVDAVTRLADWVEQQMRKGEVCRRALLGGRRSPGIRGDEPIPDHKVRPPVVR